MADERVEFILGDASRLAAKVRRSARARHVRLSLHADGALTMTAPAAMNFRDLQKLAPDFLPWLEGALARLPKAEEIRVVPRKIAIPILQREFVVEKGGDFTRGRQLSADFSRHALVSIGPERVLAGQLRDRISLFGKTHDPRILCLALQAFSRRLAEEILPARVNTLALAGKYGKVPVKVRDQRARWGSCSRGEIATGRISLNWRAILLPVTLLDHLCWHELAHLRQMNHSPAFYGELATHSPLWRENEKALTRAWRKLPSWATPAPG